MIQTRWEDLEPIGSSLKKRMPYRKEFYSGYETPEEKLKRSIREYLENSSPEELQKVVNDLVTENVIEARWNDIEEMPAPRTWVDRCQEENLKSSIKNYLINHSHEELLKILNDLVTENVIEA